MAHDITKTWQMYSDHEPPKHIDIPLPYLPQGGFVAPLGVQRYIREDLVQGDANEPMEHGQYRWVRVAHDDDWEVACIVRDPYSLKLVYFVCGEEGDENLSDCYEWGPVIRPPEDA